MPPLAVHTRHDFDPAWAGDALDAFASSGSQAAQLDSKSALSKRFVPFAPLGASAPPSFPPPGPGLGPPSPFGAPASGRPAAEDDGSSPMHAPAPASPAKPSNQSMRYGRIMGSGVSEGAAHAEAVRRHRAIPRRRRPDG